MVKWVLTLRNKWLYIHFTHSTFPIKRLCSEKDTVNIVQSKCQCILSKSLFWRRYSVFDQAKRKKKKKVLPWTAANTRLSYICLMTIFHLNTNGSQQLLQKIAVCWHPRMPSLLTRLWNPSMTIQDSVQR